MLEVYGSPCSYRQGVKSVLTTELEIKFYGVDSLVRRYIGRQQQMFSVDILISGDDFKVCDNTHADYVHFVTVSGLLLTA